MLSVISVEALRRNVNNQFNESGWQRATNRSEVVNQFPIRRPTRI